jgi:hypothetical protein
MVNDRQNLDLTTFSRPAGGGAVQWQVSDAPVPYPEAVATMEARVAAIAAGELPELVWLLEHPPLYTSGTSGRAGDLLDPRFPMFASGRGGQVTYHGPGQRVAYVMLDLKRRRPDVRAYVAGLEEWIIRTLRAFNVCGERREDRVGVWVKRPTRARALKTRSPPSACGCGAGSRSTASRSMWSRIFHTSTRSCPVAWWIRATASPASSISAISQPWPMSISRSGRRSGKSLAL